MESPKSSLEPVAITGLAFKMPQDAVDETGLWGILENGTNVKTKWPAARTNSDVFYDNGSKNPNTVAILQVDDPKMLQRIAKRFHM